MTDAEMTKRLLQALASDPGLDASTVTATVDQGVATLRGHVRSVGEKVTAERAAFRVSGVHAVANDLSVRLTGEDGWTDTDIALAAVHALRSNPALPADRITVSVEHGWATLSGTLEDYDQSAAAERAVRDLQGVKGVSNAVVLEAPGAPGVPPPRDDTP